MAHSGRWFPLLPDDTFYMHLRPALDARSLLALSSVSRGLRDAGLTCTSDYTLKLMYEEFGIPPHLARQTYDLRALYARLNHIFNVSRTTYRSQFWMSRLREHIRATIDNNEHDPVALEWLLGTFPEISAEYATYLQRMTSRNRHRELNKCLSAGNLVAAQAVLLHMDRGELDHIRRYSDTIVEVNIRAAESGNVTLVKMIMQSFEPDTVLKKYIFFSAVTSGSLPLVKYLHEVFIDDLTEPLKLEPGSLPVLTYCLQHQLIQIDKDFIVACPLMNSKEMVEAVLKDNLPLLGNNHNEILSALFEMLKNACSGGNIKSIVYIRELLDPYYSQYLAQPSKIREKQKVEYWHALAGSGKPTSCIAMLRRFQLALQATDRSAVSVCESLTERCSYLLRYAAMNGLYHLFRQVEKFYQTDVASLHADAVKNPRVALLFRNTLDVEEYLTALHRCLYLGLKGHYSEAFLMDIIQSIPKEYLSEYASEIGLWSIRCGSIALFKFSEHNFPEFNLTIETLGGAIASGYRHIPIEFVRYLIEERGMIPSERTLVIVRQLFEPEHAGVAVYLNEAIAVARQRP